MVIGGRWQLGEAAIASKGQVAGNYATEVIKGPFPEGEAAIARHDREVSALFDRWDQDLKDRWDQEAKTGGAI
jgi:hypothetical protein